jgi:hypothetical protein
VTPVQASAALQRVCGQQGNIQDFQAELADICYTKEGEIISAWNIVFHCDGSSIRILGLMLRHTENQTDVYSSGYSCDTLSSSLQRDLQTFQCDRLAMQVCDIVIVILYIILIG